MNGFCLLSDGTSIVSFRLGNSFFGSKIFQTCIVHKQLFNKQSNILLVAAKKSLAFLPMIITCWINQCIGSCDFSIVVNVFIHYSINNIFSIFFSFISISSIVCVEKLKFSISQNYLIVLLAEVLYNVKNGSPFITSKISSKILSNFSVFVDFQTKCERKCQFSRKSGRIESVCFHN